MGDDHRSGDGTSREEQIRMLGFDPDHLTPEEQRELLRLNEILAVAAPLPA